MRPLSGLFCLCALLFAIASPVAAAPKRIALVIGNHHYAEEGAALPAAERDAIDIAQALRDVQFEVDLVVDATIADFDAALQRYDALLHQNPEAETVFYYSGHGASHAGNAYLIPIDIGAVDAAGFRERALNTTKIYDIYLEQRPRLSLVILDACRTSPFTNGTDITEGLTRPPSSAPERTIVAYAHEEDKAVGSSNDGVHSAFTKAILEHIGTPGLALGDFLIAVGVQVETFTDGHQHPRVNTAQRVPFFFRDPAFVEIVSDGVDDDLVITVAGDMFIHDVDGRQKSLRLVPGDNVLTATAVNFPTRDSKLKREGWKYKATLTPRNGTTPLVTLDAGEEVADVKRSGKSFVTERVLLYVDPKSGVVSQKAHEPAVWEFGFSLIGSTPGDELYHAIRWATISRGVRLFDDAVPGSANTTRLRTEVAAQHRLATQGHPSHGSPEKDAAAHGPHLRAITIVTDAPERDVELVVDRLRREAVPQARTSLRWTCDDGAKLALVRRYFDAGEFGRVRAFYRKMELHNEEVKFLFHALSNADLGNAVEAVCRGRL